MGNENLSVEDEIMDEKPRMVTQVTKDGVVTRPATAAEIAHQDKLQDRITDRELREVEESNGVLSLLTSPEEVRVNTREIEVNGHPLLFNFKILSFGETSNVEAKRWRKDKNKQIIRDLEYEEINGTAWLIHTCVVKNSNQGKTDENGHELPAKWEPLFSLAEIRENLMKSSSQKTIELLYTLVAYCWEANPSLNPLTRAQALEQMG